MKKITKLSLLFLLTAFVLFEPFSLNIHAYNLVGARCPNGHTYAKAYLYGTSYPNANDYSHQRADYYVLICNVCSVGWEDVVYTTESHSTPNNQACVCGFVPHS
ncbi:MAG: hypothetical protein ACI4HQ_02315 [Acetatifactor sp.]